jgi:hypothetical protein
MLINAMLTPDDLIKELSTNRNKGFVDRLSARLIEQGFDLNQLIDLTFHTDAQIGFRAGWLLDVTMLAAPIHYIDNIDYFVKRMGHVTNASCMRHYTRIIMHLTAPNAPEAVKAKLSVTNLEPVVEQCFDWLIDPKVKVAVKVFAADTLFNLRDRYSWIKEELANQVQFMMREGSAAIQSRGKKLLASLQL